MLSLFLTALLLLPFSDWVHPRYDVVGYQDVCYGSARGFWSSYPCGHGDDFATVYARRLPDLASMDKLELSMDVYVPEGDGNVSRPLLLMIHGGAFFNGDKAEEEYVGWCRHFASLGYVAASVNYRLGFRPTHNEIQRAGYRAVQDANAAIRFLLDQESLQINQDCIFVAGTSAGAITALNLAFMRDEDRPHITRGGSLGDEGEIDSVGIHGGRSFTVKAVGNLWGAIQNLDMLDHSQAAVISFHSIEDPIVPYVEGYPFQEMLASVKKVKTALFDRMFGSYEINRRLKEMGRITELHTYEGGVHSIHLNKDGSLNEYYKEIQDRLAAFFAAVMEPEIPFFSEDKSKSDFLFVNYQKKFDK